MIGIIPARGGSKRLPGKNVAEFKGKPLICWTIEAGLRADVFDRLVISSDSENILDLAASYDVDLHFRDPVLASDLATVRDLAASLLNAEYSDTTDFCVLYPTAAMRTEKDIRKVCGLLGEDCDFAIAVCEVPYPWNQMLIAESSGHATPIFPHMKQARKSEVGSAYVDNGSTYAAKTKAFLEQLTFHGELLKMYEMPLLRSIDIDTASDLKFMELAYDMLKSESEHDL